MTTAFNKIYCIFLMLVMLSSSACSRYNPSSDSPESHLFSSGNIAGLESSVIKAIPVNLTGDYIVITKTLLKVFNVYDRTTKNTTLELFPLKSLLISKDRVFLYSSDKQFYIYDSTEDSTVPLQVPIPLDDIVLDMVLVDSDKVYILTSSKSEGLNATRSIVLGYYDLMSGTYERVSSFDQSFNSFVKLLKINETKLLMGFDEIKEVNLDTKYEKYFHFKVFDLTKKRIVFQDETQSSVMSKTNIVVANQDVVLIVLADGTSLLYDSKTNELSSVKAANYNSHDTITRLDNEKILLTGGEVNVPLISFERLLFFTAWGCSSYPYGIEIFDSQKKIFVKAGYLPSARKNHEAFLLTEGEVLIIGGTGASNCNLEGVPKNHYELLKL